MTLISRCLSLPSRAVVVLLLAAWALFASSADAATLTVSGSGLSVQGGASVCTYSSISESGAGNWSVVCGSGSRTISINPPVNGTACASYTSITESGLGNWTVQGCGSLSPTITLDAPSQGGQTYPTGTAFTLKATASAPSGRTVSSVQFFADGNLIHAGNLSGSQYVWDWTPATGTYLVLARVTDSTGATTDSTSRQMIFQPQGTVFYVHPDHLGTPRAITRASDNQVVWRWDNTEAFGNSAPNENPSGLGTFTYNLRFPGQFYDSESGSHYNYFRDYDPLVGRYIESDPIGLKGGLSTYSYALQSPLYFIDPLGLQNIYPGNPGINTVVCDGKGSMVSQLSNRLTPTQEKCISNCLLVHEFSHMDDFFADGSGATICKGQPKGVRPGIANAEASETKAYGAELKCLSDTLGKLSSCHECRPVIEKRIGDIRRMRGM